MLKQFAPIVVMPPSPKNTAWIINAIEIPKIEAQGPSTMVAIPTPTACPVVPPGNGRLNIMMMNENAANTDSRGTIWVLNARFIRWRETYQNGAAPAYSAAQVAGLR